MISFSIVIPTFRRESNLENLFGHLLEQIASISRSVEIVLVDNSPEASAAAIPKPDCVRYFHEPCPGVAHARNRGVTEARGDYVIFLDDDEVPAPHWLAAFADASTAGQVWFGAIEPTFETPPPSAVHDALDRLFSRRFPMAEGDDISALRAHLGSGNSLFDRKILTALTPPFDIAFNDGGEDVALLRKIVDDQNVILKWCPDALVHEIVPASRCTLPFLRRRLFKNGQLRCTIENESGDLRGTARVAFWMAAGAAQLVLAGLCALAVRPVSATRAIRFQLIAFAGAGKVLWWQNRWMA